MAGPSPREDREGSLAEEYNLLAGANDEVGDYLVDHPRTRFISFTGSRAVGLRIVERAARHQEGQPETYRSAIVTPPQTLTSSL